ncbi:MAG: alpha/beta fold hydrolase [Anaerolineae bacterium]|nr:alpha/beta fold hydrolase [Anaerolineae bacterium]
MNTQRSIAALLLALVGLALAAAACTGDESAPKPTPEPPTPAPILAPSPTINPVLPEGDGEAGASVGASNPTQAGLAAEGQPEQEPPTITPVPTEARLPMAISASDGLILQATYYGVAVRPAPGVLMLHMLGSDRSSWNDLAEQLQAAGYIVLTVDLRGHGETGGAVDWTLAPDDVRAALAQLASLPGVDAAQIAVIGASIGANLGLNACADNPGCAGVVLLSPGLDYRGITTADAMARLGARPVLIAASEQDANNPADSVTLDGLAAGDHQLVIYPAAGHGTNMLTAEPGLGNVIVDWLRAYIPPPAEASEGTP